MQNNQITAEKQQKEKWTEAQQEKASFLKRKTTKHQPIQLKINLTEENSKIKNLSTVLKVLLNNINKKASKLKIKTCLSV